MDRCKCVPTKMFMSKKAILILTVLASLIIALTAQAANIPISSLPFTISAPGTYVLTGNLTCTSPANGANGFTGAIVINVPGGGVTLNLKGFTITFAAGGAASGIVIGASTTASPQSAITIRNGTISLFNFGVVDFQMSNVTINNLTINVRSEGVLLDTVSNVAVNNCHFIGIPSTQIESAGIIDFRSSGGDSYSNNTFTNIFRFLDVETTLSESSLVLDHCNFAPPSTP
jgi:hypothetical protein